MSGYRATVSVLLLLCMPALAPIQAACGAPTPTDMEVPYYKAGAPAQPSLAEAQSKAVKLVLEGVVRSADCKPKAGVALDIWHADADGVYDMRGNRYRGVVTADAEGRYRIETNLPPPYLVFYNTVREVS